MGATAASTWQQDVDPDDAAHWARNLWPAGGRYGWLHVAKGRVTLNVSAANSSEGDSAAAVGRTTHARTRSGRRSARLRHGLIAGHQTHRPGRRPAHRRLESGWTDLIHHRKRTCLLQPPSVRTPNIDLAHSEITFQVRHLLSKVRGRFSAFGGTITYDAATPPHRRST